MSSAALKILPWPGSRTRLRAATPICLPVTGPKSLGPASSPPKRPSFEIPKARLKSILKEPALPHFITLLKGHAQEAAQCQQAAVARQALHDEWEVLRARLLAKAEAEQWSHRRLIKETKLSWGAWGHLNAGEADLTVWIPRVRAAVERLAVIPFPVSA